MIDLNASWPAWKKKICIIFMDTHCLGFFAAFTNKAWIHNVSPPRMCKQHCWGSGWYWPETQNTKYQHSLKKCNLWQTLRPGHHPGSSFKSKIFSAAHRLICSSISSKTSTDLEQVVISIQNYNFKRCTMERKKECKIWGQWVISTTLLKTDERKGACRSG